MKTICSDKHLLHSPAKEIICGEVLDCFEKPDRMAFIKEALKARKLGEFIEPENFSLDPVLRVHDRGYIDFLQTAYENWDKEGFKGDVFASTYNVQHPGAPVPHCTEGKAGYYLADGCVPLTKTSWHAIEGSAHIALTGSKLIANGERSAFTLCRPPGHHATRAVASGYCFVNNAAVAAQALLDQGASRVAILDVDYHHGNGTQDIFYDRGDVLFLSIHADPYVEYPYFRGHADEKGEGQGEGYNVNYPLPLGIDYSAYEKALQEAVKRITAYGPDALVISLGVDSYMEDPISHFKLASDDFTRIGGLIAKANTPSLFVMEGGYAVSAIGTNVANVLTGFLDG